MCDRLTKQLVRHTHTCHHHSARIIIQRLLNCQEAQIFSQPIPLELWLAPTVLRSELVCGINAKSQHQLCTQ